MKCPVCHSSKVKGFKVHTQGRWWHRCVSGRDHGLYVLPNGEEHKMPEALYFDEKGLVGTPHGNLQVIRQTRTKA